MPSLNRFMYCCYPVIAMAVLAAALLVGILTRWYYGLAVIFSWILAIHIPMYGNAKGWAKSLIFPKYILLVALARKTQNVQDLMIAILKSHCGGDDLLAANAFASIESIATGLGGERVNFVHVMMWICTTEWVKLKRRLATDSEIQSFSDAINEVISGP